MFDTIVTVDASEGLKTVGTSNGGPQSQSILHNKQALLNVKVLVDMFRSAVFCCEFTFTTSVVNCEN